MINGKESYLVVTRHVSWAQTITQMLQPLWQLRMLPQRRLQPEGERAWKRGRGQHKEEGREDGKGERTGERREEEEVTRRKEALPVSQKARAANEVTVRITIMVRVCVRTAHKQHFSAANTVL